MAFRVGETVVPMETLDDPGLQAYFERTRGRAGVRLVGLREAQTRTAAALRRGVPSGSSVIATSPAVGPRSSSSARRRSCRWARAMLAVESGVPTFALAVRRVAGAPLSGPVIPIEVPADGSRRERVTPR
jgi:hypothetical protein